MRDDIDLYNRSKCWLTNPLDWFYCNVSYHVLCAYNSDLDSTWSVQRYRTYYNRIYMVHRGEGAIFVNGVRHTLRSGCIYFIPSGVLLNLSTTHGLGLHWCHFTAETEFGGELFETLRTPVSLPVEHIDVQSVYFRRMESAMEGGESCLGHLQRTMWLLKLLLPFLRAAEQDPGSREEQFFSPVLEFIHANLYRPVTLEELAGTMNCSREHFTRSFSRAFGMPPVEYATNKRIQRAQRLLSNDVDPIHTVGEMCGFADPSQFSRCFKRVVGMSPIAFRDLETSG